MSYHETITENSNVHSKNGGNSKLLFNPKQVPGLNVAGKLFFTSLCIGTFGLGIWQTQRYYEKRILEEERIHDLKQIPIALNDYYHYLLQHQQQVRKQQQQQQITSTIPIITTTPTTTTTTIPTESNTKNNCFRRIVVNGQFDYDNEFVVGPRGPPPGALPDKPGGNAAGSGGLAPSTQGYYIVTPFHIRNNNNIEQQQNDDDNEGEKALSSSRKQSIFTRFFASKNQVSSKNKPPSNDDDTTTILVNRGWVPRHFVVDDTIPQRGRQRQQQGQQQQKQQHDMMMIQRDNNPNNNKNKLKLLRQWNRPKGNVQVVVIPAEPEVPRFFVADHQLKENPPRLYWFDFPTMLACARMPFTMTTNPTTHTTLTITESSSLSVLDAPATSDNNNSSLEHIVHTLRYVQQVQSPMDTTDSIIMMDRDKNNPKDWPACPTIERMGDFKVTSAVHASYAFTWFSLSTAGVFMTRMLLKKGR